MADLVVQALVLAGSLGVLALAGQFMIRAVEQLIELTGLSEASVGFAILSVITSMPEMTVAVFSILEGVPGVTIGDILGSNVANIGLVVALMAIIGPLETCCTDLLLEMVDILFLSSLIPLLLISLGSLSSYVGLLLLAVFVFSLYRMTKGVHPVLVDEEEPLPPPPTTGKAVVVGKILVGVVAITLAARFAVSSVSDLTVLLGIPAILLGAKVVAVGTSLPEIVISVSAVRKGRPRLAMGNAIGSNLTNLTLILGTVLLLAPFAVDLVVFTETLPFLLGTTLLLWRFLTKGGISKVGGVVLLASYVLFQLLVV
jgi:cation:H+ antiporter